MGVRLTKKATGQRRNTLKGWKITKLESMITSTFLHIPRVSRLTEQKLWQSGTRTWNDFLQADNIKGFSPMRKAHADSILRRSHKALVLGESEFFTQLPSTEHWRMWETFKDETVYVDIETNWKHDVTVLGIYDGNEVMQFVKGKNLSRAAVEKYLRGKLIVTYNGASFDLPVIRKCFGAASVPRIPHFDTRHLAARLGMKGGLKLLEVQLGIKRPQAVVGMSGQDALHLWDLYRASGEEAYLNKLLAYNEEDIVNLQTVAKDLYRQASHNLLVETHR